MANSDITQLAKDLVPYILPLLPYLVKTGKVAGTEAAKALGKKLGEDIPSSLRKLWKRLLEKVETSSATQEALQDVIVRPEDGRTIAALELQLEKLLGKDEIFLHDIITILQEIRAQGVVIQSSLEIEEHKGELRIVNIEDVTALREAGISQIDAQTKIKHTDKGSKTEGVRFGQIGKQVGTKNEADPDQ